MIFVLIPIFNEEENIPNLFAQVKNALPDDDSFFVFSDDGSKDRSKEVIAELFKDIPHIVLGDGINYGPGNAFNVGFEWVLKNSKSDSDQVVTMEADCTSDIRILDKMIVISRLGYDLVLASVYAQGGGFDKTSFFRKILSAFANMFFRFLFDIKVLTLSSFYRVYSIGILKRIRQDHENIISEKGFICMVEVLIKAISSKASVIEVPMILSSHKRIGKSKMKTFKTMITYFNFMIKWKFNGSK